MHVAPARPAADPAGEGPQLLDEQRLLAGAGAQGAFVGDAVGAAPEGIVLLPEHGAIPAQEGIDVAVEIALDRAGERTEPLLQGPPIERDQLPQRVYAGFLQLSPGDRADAREGRDGQRCDERALFTSRDRAHRAGGGLAARDLGDRSGRAHPDHDA